MTLPASVLIVDDDRELGQMLTEYLTGEGFQVSLVRDGAEALDRLTGDSHPFDLVILDVMLPSLNAWRANATLFSVEVSSSDSCIMF